MTEKTAETSKIPKVLIAKQYINEFMDYFPEAISPEFKQRQAAGEFSVETVFLFNQAIQRLRDEVYALVITGLMFGDNPSGGLEVMEQAKAQGARVIFDTNLRSTDNRKQIPEGTLITNVFEAKKGQIEEIRQKIHAILDEITGKNASEATEAISV